MLEFEIKVGVSVTLMGVSVTKVGISVTKVGVSVTSNYNRGYSASGMASIFTISLRFNVILNRCIRSPSLSRLRNIRFI